MFRLLGGMILGALILLALSDSVRKDIEPYLERGSKLTEDLLNRVREKVRGSDAARAPEGGEEAESIDKAQTPPEPSSNPPDHPVGDAEVAKRAGSAAEKALPAPQDPAFLRERGTVHQEGPAGPESFPDIYEKARARLLQAMEILEGKGDAGD